MGAPAFLVRRPSRFAVGLILVFALLMPGCEKVNEQAFRDELAGPWAQATLYSVKPYWEFTREGTIKDLEGREIGTFASAGNYRRIRIDIPGQVSFTSEFALAAKGKSISFVDSNFDPFTRVDARLRNRALFEIQKPAIFQNLESLIRAAQTIRNEGGPLKLTYADLVGAGKPIPEMKSVAGEDYTKLVLDGDATLRVFTSYGMELTAHE